ARLEGVRPRRRVRGDGPGGAVLAALPRAERLPVVPGLERLLAVRVADLEVDQGRPGRPAGHPDGGGDRGPAGHGGGAEAVVHGGGADAAVDGVSRRREGGARRSGGQGRGRGGAEDGGTGGATAGAGSGQGERTGGIVGPGLLAEVAPVVVGAEGEAGVPVDR